MSALFYDVSEAPPTLLGAPLTVSGVSAGCFMATQMHFAYSSVISGMACTAGGPYWCAQASLDFALNECMDGAAAGAIDIDYLERIVRNTADFGFIDPVENLAASRAWFYTALNDTVVAPKVVWKNYQLYERFVPATNLTIISDMPGEHAQITADYGNDCQTLGSPFINNCGYDSAAAQLQFLYPDTALTATWDGSIYTVEQPGGDAAGLADTGYIWIPNRCFSSPCPLHVAFHGCEQTAESIGLTYVLHAGYSGYDTIAVYFPQAVASPMNPRGCFDWWGYTGADYASNIGPQMMVIRSVIKSLAHI